MSLKKMLEARWRTLMIEAGLTDLVIKVDKNYASGVTEDGVTVVYDDLLPDSLPVNNIKMKSFKKNELGYYE